MQKFLLIVFLLASVVCTEPGQAKVFATLPATGPSKPIAAKSKVVEIGDIHGDFDALVKILYKAKVITRGGDFRAFDSDIIFLGDLIGNGPDSRRVLDLVIWLQQSAPDFESRVHVVAGNHELYALEGNLTRLSTFDRKSLAKKYGKAGNAFIGNTKYAKFFRSMVAVLSLERADGVHWYTHGSLREYVSTTTPERLNLTLKAWVSYLQGVGKKPPNNTRWIIENEGPLVDRSLVDGSVKSKKISSWFKNFSNLRSINLGHTPTETGRIESIDYGSLRVNQFDTSISIAKGIDTSRLRFRVIENGVENNRNISRPKSSYAERKCQGLLAHLGYSN